MDRRIKQQLIEQLKEWVTPRRWELFSQVIEQRTRRLTVVVENIYQPHNASAILRTCDLTGVQDVHIIENSNEYEVNPEVAMGASKWLNFNRYSEGSFNTPEVYARLRSQGYQIVATTPHQDGFTPESLPLDSKVALVFGTELTGLSDWAIEHADAYLQIPMVGFTESYNISVSAALCLYTLSGRVRRSDANWQLTEEEREDVILQWLRNSIKRSDVLEQQLLEKLTT